MESSVKERCLGYVFFFCFYDHPGNFLSELQEEMTMDAIISLGIKFGTFPEHIDDIQQFMGIIYLFG
jgi:hypothetical protein